MPSTQGSKAFTVLWWNWFEIHMAFQEDGEAIGVLVLFVLNGTILFGGCGALMFELDVIFFLGWHVFKDGLRLDNLKLGLEVFCSASVARRVAAATGVCHVGGNIHNLVTRMAPVSLASALLLNFLGIGVDETSFSKELGDMLGRTSVVGVVTISELVATCHVE